MRAPNGAVGSADDGSIWGDNTATGRQIDPMPASAEQCKRMVSAVSSPLKLIPMVMVDKRHLMMLSNRKWKPEPGWCRHGWRTYVVPTRDDPTKGIRLHGQAEDFGVLLEVKPRCLPLDAPRQRRRPEREMRWEKEESA